ncbi:UNVERIFIED_CONTAM: hypothetical protein Sradi_0241400 [Sesamum radiatum]|uniref:Uncharacterized protein n=1 Tax=Sesamum radiatum TaxID=300843 RepID=A0AAW2W2C2_SESRA
MFRFRRREDRVLRRCHQNPHGEAPRRRDHVPVPGPHDLPRRLLLHRPPHPFTRHRRRARPWPNLLPSSPRLLHEHRPLRFCPGDAGSGGPNNNKRGGPVSFKECPFEYLRGSDGRVVIRVVPEFITRLISRNDDHDDDDNKENIISDGCGNGGNRFLCSTPELQKHYNQLVGCRDQNWSPKLETISEYKIRFSPCRFIGLEWKQKEVEG